MNDGPIAARRLVCDGDDELCFTALAHRRRPQTGARSDASIEAARLDKIMASVSAASLLLRNREIELSNRIIGQPRSVGASRLPAGDSSANRP